MLNTTFHINESLTQVKKLSEGRALLVLRYLGRLYTLGKLEPNRAVIPQITVKKMQKVIESLQLIISHQPRPYSSAMNSKGQVLHILGYLGHWDNLGKLGPNSLISSEFLIFIISTSAHLNLISIMGSMKFSCRAV